MALLDILAQYNANIYLDNDPLWRQFICDHRAVLIANAPRYTPSPDLMTQVGGDLTRYLTKIGIYDPIAWIVAYLNELGSDVYFTESMTLSVPNVSQLSMLYQSYITTKQVKTG